jgi:hypothetical protein
MNITKASLFPGLEGYARSQQRVLLQRQMRLDRSLSRAGRKPVQHLGDGCGE